METMFGGGSCGWPCHRCQHESGMITAYLPFLINSIDRIDLSIWLAVIQLQVVRLNIIYVIDLMRSYDRWRNIGIWRKYAADLQVTAHDVYGTIM